MASIMESQKKFVSKTRQKPRNFTITGLSGGDEGDRTLYLLNAIQALSQVSYVPET
jgi:hypothetical protein